MTHQNVIILESPGLADASAVFSELDLVVPSLRISYSSCKFNIVETVLVPHTLWKFTVTGLTPSGKSFTEDYEARLVGVFTEPQHL